MGRQPNTFNKIPVGDPKDWRDLIPIIDRLQDRIVEGMRPISSNTFFSVASFRLVENAGTGGVAPTLGLQYRNGTTWTQVGHWDSAGVYTAGS